MITALNAEAPTVAPLSHSQAVYVDELRRMLAFIADARRREDAAYTRWEDASLDAHHHNDARADYLRAYDEADYWQERLQHLWARCPDVFAGYATLADLLAHV